MCGAIAQLGERVNGIHEVGGSIPPGSTTPFRQSAFDSSRCLKPRDVTLACAERGMHVLR